MNTRMVAALATVLGATACGASANEGNAPTQPFADITVDGNTHEAQSVSCTQVGWLLSVEAAADPGKVRTSLRLSGAEPTALTVNIEDVDGFYGISGDHVDGVESRTEFADGTYTISGTARGSDPKKPSIERTADFRFDVRC